MRNLNKLISCGTGHGTMYICANGDVYSCPNMMNKNYVIGNGLLVRVVYKDFLESPMFALLKCFGRGYQEARQ